MNIKSRPIDVNSLVPAVLALLHLLTVIAITVFHSAKRGDSEYQALTYKVLPHLLIQVVVECLKVEPVHTVLRFLQSPTDFALQAVVADVFSQLFLQEISRETDVPE
jgi:hypothetical protein